jgi:GNAT superfamily N-acetyltransferase
LSDVPVVTDFNLRLAAETEQLQLDRDCVQAGVFALLKDSSKGTYFLAVAADTIVGQAMITYEWSDWRNGNIWWLQSVYVRPEFRKQGVFRQLFRHIQELARREPGVWGLRLYMHSSNDRARAAYASLGMGCTQYQVFELDLSNGGPT